jgi:hypothetical protein
VNTIHIHKVVDSVIGRLPNLGDTVASNKETPNSPILNAFITNATDNIVVLSDLKAVSFVLENALTYCLNVTRRKIVELKGRLRRPVHFAEFRPIKITMEIRQEPEPFEGDEHVEPKDFMQFVITFGVLAASDADMVEQLIDECIQAIDSNSPSFTCPFEVCIQSALDEIKRPRYLHERLSTAHDNSSILGAETEGFLRSPQPLPPPPARGARQSTILMTAKQMLDSCGGSLKLLEIAIPGPSATSFALKSGGDVNVLILNIPCQIEGGLAPMYDELTGKLHLESARGTFDFGLLVTDNELCEYAQRMFLECGVKCCRITSNSHLPLDNYTAIITDSLATYANVRVKGFHGKVVVMSTAAVYIDGNFSNRSCDFVLPVPFQLTDVQELIHSLYYKDLHQSSSRRPSLLSLLIRTEETLRSYSSVPIIYFITQLIGGIKSHFVSLSEFVQDSLHWLRLRAESRLNMEREKNEIFQLGQQYDMVGRWWLSRSFKTDIESKSTPSSAMDPPYPSIS